MTTRPTTEPLQETIPCRFCGGPITKVERRQRAGCYVVCTHCCAQGPAHHTAQEAVEAWNTRATPESEEWQPIETAPKDGTKVLCAWAKTFHATPHAEVCECGEEGYWFYSYDGDAPAPDDPPTHWMPLAAMRSTDKGA